MCSSSRWRPLRVLPTCQSEVCRNFIVGSFRRVGSAGMVGRAWQALRTGRVVGSSAIGAVVAVEVGQQRERVSGCRRRAAAVAAVAGGRRGWRRSGSATSDRRVAQAGNGNSTASGTGISGWETNMVPGLASVARLRCEAGRNPYSGRPASAGSSRPTILIEEFDTMRRSTSEAVCWAPMRMMPRRAAAFGDVEQDVLDRGRPSRGAYLFSSSSIVNSSPPGPAASLRSVSAARTTPTTNRWARSCRACRSTTVTCWFAVEICAGRRLSGRSPRMIGARCRWEDRSRRMNALTVPMPVTGPAHRRSLVSSVTLSHDEVDQVGPGPARDARRSTTAPSLPAATASRLAAGRRPGGRPSCTGSSRPRRRRTRSGSSSRSQNSASVHQNALTPDVRPLTCGRPVWSPGSGRGEEAGRGERRRGQAEARVLGALGVGRA